MSDEDTLFGIKGISFEEWKKNSIDLTTVDVNKALYKSRKMLEKELENFHPDIQKMHLNTFDELFPGVKDYNPTTNAKPGGD